MHVVDAGTGTGLFMVPLSNLVGPNGRLYCQEIGNKWIPFLENKICMFLYELFS